VAAESRGAVFFREWLRKLGSEIFAHPYDPAAPLSTPRGLAKPPQAVDKLLEAARHMRTTYGALDVKWGDVYRLQWGAADFPASGGQDFMGIFHALSFNPDGNGRFVSRGGESYSSIVEFSDPVRAQVLLSYGNSSQEGSPHVGDQLALVAAGTMRPALLSDADIQGALARRDRLSPANGDCNEH
jgi:acyl-homoserine-lactone acylase